MTSGTVSHAAAGSDSLTGTWNVIPPLSAEIGLYRTLSLGISLEDDSVRITHRWGGARALEETMVLPLDGTPEQIPFESRVFPTNVFMGLSQPVGGSKTVTARLSEDKRSLSISETWYIQASQGPAPLNVRRTFTCDDNAPVLTYAIDRSTRKSDTPVTYILKRAGAREAWYMQLNNDWRIDGDLARQACVISMQGLVNRNGPLLYFIYPDTWDFRFTPGVKTFLESDHYYTFREIRSLQQAFSLFKSSLKGYVVWDKEVRTSLVVAFTIAGLEDAVVVSEDLIPLAEAAGLTPAADLRGRFAGLSDAAIYEWAVERYWDRCSHEMLVWMGGEAGGVMKPGVADWGIYSRAFFQDLSTKPSDEEEYALACRLLADLQPMSLIFGWHSYAKDKERDHVTLTSRYGHRVEGLHTLPNMSFSSQVAATPGFAYRNNHTIEPGKRYLPENMVYIACVQTDCLGLGAWTRPGRGEIPYAWEVTMNWSWLAPAMMEFFYTQATPNDYFIGALSGPGYLYPKAVPDSLLPRLITTAAGLMRDLDLNVFEIMDYSEGATVEGNTELTEPVVHAYYEGMPDAIGFINGYAPARTFTCRDGRPLISYDYYLSPERSEAAAAADLEELAVINGKRPYFLLMHVRQWSDISRVKGILDRLGPEFTVVPLDLFLKMAGEQPTFREKLLSH
ncbi:hypothetical protein JXO52_14265 [bacterium]|nr:hypothetical protein [bacterium]